MSEGFATEQTARERLVPPESIQGAEGLPDLTSRLQEYGVYGEYVEYRDGYMRWRQGLAKGAKGENTADDHEKRSAQFQHWYPTVKTFNFRRTIAFWGAVTCAEGCLLFLWISYVSTYGNFSDKMLYELTKVPNLVGGTFFLAGIYLAYFELINIDSANINASKFNFVWCDLKVLKGFEIETASFLGSLQYMIGALFYTLSQISDFWDWGTAWHACLIEWPLIVGGFLFFGAGICELVVNRVFTRWPTAYVWWAAVFNCYGGLTFWLSACPSVCPGDSATVVGASGTVAYLVAAILTLLMWRGEQFGGAMIPALNRAVEVPVTVRRDPKTGLMQIIPSSMVKKSEVEDALNPRLSWRGVVFLNVYVVIGAAQVIACCSCLDHRRDFWNNPERFRRFLSVFLSSLVNIIIVHMVLVLNSATVTMPKRGDEPYRSLAIAMRLLSIIVLLNTLMTLEVQLDDY